MEPAASATLFARRAGVLAHVSSLPGPGPCGDLGTATTRFLDWCAAAGLSIWQVLPLGPAGPGDSPYACTSAFAASPLWFPADPAAEAGDGDVDFSLAAAGKQRRLETAWLRFVRDARAEDREALARWLEEQHGWVDEWSLYTALKERHGGGAWTTWDAELRRRDPGALRAARSELAERMRFHAWVQFAIDRHARAVRQAAEDRGIVWFGDLPFYVALDSADVWSRRELFRVDADGVPEAIAGVPPDAFSDDGQRWDHPLFDWEAQAAEGYAWWLARCRHALGRLHALRLDHFRGYRAFWEIPGDANTAAGGRWVDGPGESLLDAVRDAGMLDRLVVEDLGEITDDVVRLRDAYGLPGMHVLQFGLDDEHSTHHPDRHREHSLACTGTHDNDTFEGWYAALDPLARERVAPQVTGRGAVAAAGVELAWSSRAAWSVTPLQDLLGLGSDARMNEPGKPKGQWRWRCAANALDERRAAELRELARRYGRG